MSWLFKSDWVANPRNPTNADLDNLAKDDLTWGGDVDSGGYRLLNVGSFASILRVSQSLVAATTLLELNNVAGSFQETRLDFSVAGSVPVARIGASYNAGSDVSLAFSTYGAGGLSEKVRITKDGLFGIGTSAPVTTTEILGGASDPSLSADRGTVSVTSTVTNQLQIGISSANPYGVWMQGKNRSNSGITYPICINPLGGFVGIGTSSPTSALHVVGIPTYASDALAGVGGLTAGAAYKHADGSAYWKL